MLFLCGNTFLQTSWRNKICLQKNSRKGMVMWWMLLLRSFTAISLLTKMSCFSPPPPPVWSEPKIYDMIIIFWMNFLLGCCHSLLFQLCKKTDGVISAEKKSRIKISWVNPIKYVWSTKIVLQLLMY